MVCKKCEKFLSKASAPDPFVRVTMESMSSGDDANAAIAEPECGQLAGYLGIRCRSITRRKCAACRRRAQGWRKQAVIQVESIFAAWAQVQAVQAECDAGAR